MKRWMTLVLMLLWFAPMRAEKGKIFETTLRSRYLKNTHEIWIYTPPGYQEQADSYPLLIVFDGQAYTSDEWIPTPRILDELINAEQIRPLVAIFISSGDQRRRNKELPCYEPFARFVAKEVLAYMHKHYRISSKARDVVVAGSSYGGLAAAYVALGHSDLIGNVLSQSGAFYWAQPKCDQNPKYLIRQYSRAEPLPIRFYLEVGDKETEGRNNIVSVNREMAQVLRQKGNEVIYREFQGGHEYRCWREALPTGLKALLGTTPPID